MLAQVVRPNGTVAAYGSGLEMSPTFPFGTYLFRAITLDIILIYLLPSAQRKTAINHLHKALVEGGLKPAVCSIRLPSGACCSGGRQAVWRCFIANRHRLRTACRDYVSRPAQNRTQYLGFCRHRLHGIISSSTESYHAY